MSKESKSITAQNTFTDGVLFTGGESVRDIGVSISGTFVANVTVQRSFGRDVDADYNDLDPVFTGAEEQNIIVTRKAFYRVGVKTGDFTSGTVEVEILV